MMRWERNVPADGSAGPPRRPPMRHVVGQPAFRTWQDGFTSAGLWAAALAAASTAFWYPDHVWHRVGAALLLALFALWATTESYPKERPVPERHIAGAAAHDD